MSSRLIALVASGVVALGLVGAAGAHGGHHGRWSNLSADDRAAFQDARIAAFHAGLKLTPDQEKLWPPVEAAMRGLFAMRQERRTAMENRPNFEEDAPGALRSMADAASARADALRKLADATQPLYASLSDDQKRRAAVLARPMGMMGRGHPGHRHHDDDERGEDRH